MQRRSKWRREEKKRKGRERGRKKRKTERKEEKQGKGGALEFRNFTAEMKILAEDLNTKLKKSYKIKI